MERRLSARFAEIGERHVVSRRAGRKIRRRQAAWLAPLRTMFSVGPSGFPILSASPSSVGAQSASLTGYFKQWAVGRWARSGTG